MIPLKKLRFLEVLRFEVDPDKFYYEKLTSEQESLFTGQKRLRLVEVTPRYPLTQDQQSNELNIVN